MILCEDLPVAHRKLSVLGSVQPGFTTYYTGANIQDLAHLEGCSVLLRKGGSHLVPAGVNAIEVEDPQLAFYLLSREFNRDFLEYSMLEEKGGARIHSRAVIAESAVIGPGSVIGDCVIGEGVSIGSNTTIFSGTTVGSESMIDCNSAIGAAGMMWIWDGEEKVFLEQLGGVRIEENCRVGSNITIVRGSANEMTVLGSGSCVAHGSMIGHGCRIGRSNHLANSVALGGSVVSGPGCFFGSGSVVSPGMSLVDGVILGAGAVLAHSAERAGIYVGVPAKWKSEVSERMSGIPRWTR